MQKNNTSDFVVRNASYISKKKQKKLKNYMKQYNEIVCLSVGTDRFTMKIVNGWQLYSCKFTKCMLTLSKATLEASTKLVNQLTNNMQDATRKHIMYWARKCRLIYHIILGLSTLRDSTLIF